MKNFNEFITEEISPIRMDDEEREEYERNRDNNYSGVMANHFRGDDDFDTTKYKIYTSQDGIIEFDDSILEPYGDEDDVFFLNMEWREKFDTFISAMDVKFDKDKMFIFMETDHGDIAEYKVFID